MRALIPLAEGVEELEAVTIMNVLRRAGVKCVSVSLTDERTVRGSRDIKLVADATWYAVDEATFDVIILPGGGPGTERLMADERVIKAVQFFAQRGKFVAAICAAPMVLAKAQVLEGRKATCYPSCAQALGESFDDVPVVVDDKIITGQGPGTALLFSLVLVEHLVDSKVAEQVAAEMLTSF